MKDNTMKKEYIKPAMQVVLLQHQSHLMQTSGEVVRSMGDSSSEWFDFDSEGFDDKEVFR
jgi:hypothetical protein